MTSSYQLAEPKTGTDRVHLDVNAGHGAVDRRRPGRTSRSSSPRLVDRAVGPEGNELRLQ